LGAAEGQEGQTLASAVFPNSKQAARRGAGLLLSVTDERDAVAFCLFGHGDRHLATAAEEKRSRPAPLHPANRLGLSRLTKRGILAQY